MTEPRTTPPPRRPRCRRRGHRLPPTAWPRRTPRPEGPAPDEDGRVRTDVAATLTMTSPEPATALLQIAVADPATEQLTVLSGGAAVEPEELAANGARVHRLTLAVGD